MPARRRPAFLLELERIDVAVYTAVAATPTPTLDGTMRRLSSAADHAKLWTAAAAALALTRGAPGRRAAASGIASLGATSALVNLVVKPLARRRRPDREIHGVPLIRHVPMPASHSLPSGHAASAFAFATGAGSVLPKESALLHALATAVAYSRVHTGVHFLGDTALGALLGTAVAQVTSHAIARRGRR